MERIIKNRTQFGNLLKHDIQMGILLEWKKFVPVCFVVISSCIVLYQAVQNLSVSGDIQSTVTLMDYALYFFKGMEVYVPSPETRFEIPFLWIVFHSYLAFIIGNYPQKDLLGYGQNILIRVKSRTKWWFSKCGWACLSVLSYYIICWLSIIIVTAFTGSLSFSASIDITSLLNMLAVSDVNSNQLILTVVLLPFLTSITITLVQILISFILKPLLSYICVFVFLAVSIYFYSPFLIGNFSVVCRNDIFKVDGINTYVAILVCMVIILFVLIFGKHYFKKYDILNKN